MDKEYFDQDLAPFKAKLDFTHSLMNAVTIVLFIGLVGVFATVFIYIGGATVSRLAEKQASYDNLQDEVQTQNTTLQTQTDQIEALTKKIGDLQWMISQQK